MITSGLFTSLTDMWETPQELFDTLDSEFHFDIDVCATQDNAKCKRFYSKEQDGLAQEWRGVCWMNPPYGRKIGQWIEKAYKSSLDGAIVVCLVPARTDTAWFQDYILGKAEIRFLRGRIKFCNTKNSAPFPSAVVIFRTSKSGN